MEFLPSRREFEKLRRSGRRVPVGARIPLEAQPEDLFEALDFKPPCLLLQSARLHPVTGRYSILVGEPVEILTAQGGEVWVEAGPAPLADYSFVSQEASAAVRQMLIRQRCGAGAELRSCAADPLVVLERMVRSRPALRVPGLPPFVGGATGFLSYDLSRRLERIPSLAQDDLGLPEAGFLFCDQAVVVDHAEEQVWAIALARSSGGMAAAKGSGTTALGPVRAYDEAVARVEALLKRVRRSHSLGEGARVKGEGPFPIPYALHPAPISSTHSRASFEAMVRRAKGYIADGEIYQANLSQRLSMPLADSPWRLYRRLTEMNPSPFAAYADWGHLQIVSASPERFLRVRGDGLVETRPIAGTRPLGHTAVETLRLRRELILNEKERAEHLMLVDLERNDLGRVCRYGSVRVDDLMTLEEYSHVIHIVSNVQGQLRRGVGIRDLIAATFPGGTISGCPKIRSQEVIDELEPVRRHLYTGALGYVSATGDLDLNLLIRTAFVHQGQVYVQVGAGIVADSDPGREYEETLHKAQALLEVCAPEGEPVAERP